MYFLITERYRGRESVAERFKSLDSDRRKFIHRRQRRMLRSFLELIPTATQTRQNCLVLSRPLPGCELDSRQLKTVADRNDTTRYEMLF